MQLCSLIREAVSSDIESILPLSEKLWDVSAFQGRFDAEHNKKVLQASIDQELLFIIDAAGVQGFLCLFKAPTLGNPQLIVATEAGFWIARRYRWLAKLLIEKAENAARSAGVHYLYMVSLENYYPSLSAKVYTDMGYQKSETNYIKVL